MRISVGDSVQGHRNTATFLFSVPASVGACTLPITPDSLVARITSGSDVVWSSDDCPDALLAKEVVVRHDPPTVYSFEWNGHRSTQGCATSGDVAPPGKYTLEAAFVSGDPHEAFFTIVPGHSTRH
jgi:hypothetical protein